MKIVTKIRAKTVWENNIANTTYIDTTNTILKGKPVRAYDMYQMFIEKGFGKAEANCIVAALVMAGAKFEE